MGKTKLSPADLQLIKEFCKTMPIYERRHLGGPKKGEFIMGKDVKGNIIHIMTNPYEWMVKICRDKGVSELPKYYQAYLDEYKEVKAVMQKIAFDKAKQSYGHGTT